MTQDTSTSASSSNNFDLDSLLDESIKLRAEAGNIKGAREALAKGGMSAAERDAVQATVRAWELRREWTPVASTLLFSRQMCQTCKSFHTHTLGYFQKQQHRTTGIMRWIAAIKPIDKSLPREAKYEDSLVAICHECADLEDWELEEN
jgi:hypothetical protein